MSLPPDLLGRAIQDDRLREAAQRHRQWSAQLASAAPWQQATSLMGSVWASVKARRWRHAADAALGNEVRPQTGVVRG